MSPGNETRCLRTLTAVAAATLALASAQAAGAGISVGVNDDATVESATASWFFPAMQAEGLSVDTVTLRWDESSPSAIPAAEIAAVTTDIEAAARAGVTIELDLYPLHAAALDDGVRCRSVAGPQQCGDTVRIARFAAWTALVARTFPSVHEFVVMNECNQPAFSQPQWTAAGTSQSAEVCGRALAAAYDALHAVSDRNVVWGLGLSPRGNDDPSAPTDSSASPVRFLAALGAWFRAFAAQTGRRAPLMDGLDVHPYPVPQSLPFATGYANPDDVTVSNLPRLYQAFYDAFHGTPQPTIGEQAGGGLPVSVNEVGIQTAQAGLPGYYGVKAAADAAGGVVGSFATQSYQAAWYRRMLGLLACDPNVRIVNIFKLVDEPDLAGWQSGLFEDSPTGTPIPKQSAQAVRAWIAATGGACQGATHPWRPARAAPASVRAEPRPTASPAASRPPGRPSVPAAAVAGDPFPPGLRGFDVSFPNCRARLPAHGFVVVGVNGGRPFTANPCLAREAARARAASRPLAVYLNAAYARRLLGRTRPSCGRLGSRQDLPLAERRAYALGCSEAASAHSLLRAAIRPSLYWLDVEPSNAWSANRALNVATIRGMLDYLRGLRPAPLVGLYSAASWWRAITGGWRTIGLPEWVPAALTPPPACEHGFAGGPVWLRQGGSAGLDVDVAC
jgi:hypothetical protein